MLDKPAGVAVVGDPPLLEHPDGYHPVHRLDRGTSGVIVYATADTLGELGTLFAAGSVDKVYLALVWGAVRKKGIVRRKIDGREAVTRYRCLQRFGKVSLVRARPQTGRKHQIRRHLHGIGHPIVGDTRYKRGNKRLAGAPARLWLHAAELDLDGQRFTSPLPPELQSHLDRLKGAP